MIKEASFNRLANVSNRFQTEAKRVLCLCSAGLLRSPTMANVLHQEYTYNTRAAGVTEEYALIPIDSALIEWSDEIVCANKEVADTLSELLYDSAYNMEDTLAKVTVLNIPDRYEWNAPELRGIILRQYEAAHDD